MGLPTKIVDDPRTSKHYKKPAFFFDVIIKQACFSKQECKDEIAAMEGRILLDVPKNMWMSQAKQVHVLCNKNVL